MYKGAVHLLSTLYMNFHFCVLITKSDYADECNMRWKSSDYYPVLILYTFELTYVTTIASPNCVQRQVQKIRQDTHCYVVV